jgi:hypothetical protein
LSGLQVGIETVDVLHVRVWLRDIDLGTVEIAPAVSDAAYDQPQPPRRRSNSPKAA